MSKIPIKMNKSQIITFDRNLPFNALPDLPPSEDIIDKETLIQWGLASRALAELNKKHKTSYSSASITSGY
jgi:hypothetical protein